MYQIETTHNTTASSTPLCDHKQETKTTEAKHEFTWPPTDRTCCLYHLDALTMANKFQKNHFRTSTHTVVHTSPVETVCIQDLLNYSL